MGARPFGAAAVVACWGACADSPGSEPWTRADSAGIKIIVSDPATPGWTGALEPVLTLGTLAEGGPTEFLQVLDLEFLDSSTFAVANAGSEQVRVFSTDGTFLRGFGMPGRGPEKFRDLRMVRDFADSLLTYDEGNDRLGVRDRGGALHRSFRLEWFSGSLFPVDLSPSRRILAVTARYMTELSATGRVVDTSLVSLYDLEGSLIDSVVRLPHNERFVKQVGDMRTTVSAPFSAPASLASTESGFCYAFGPVAEVRCYGVDGTLIRVSRIRRDPRPVEEADIQRYWDDVWEEAEGAYRDVMLRVRDDITFPEHFPAISALVVDDEGRVWARQYRVDPTEDDAWWVFRSGELVGMLASPTGFEVLDVEGGLVGGVWRDELGVEHVRIYRLRFTSE